MTASVFAFRHSVLLIFAVVAFACGLPPAVAQQSNEVSAADWIHHIEEFGPLGDATEAQQTWQAARAALQGQAGILVVPARVWPMLNPDSLQSLIRIPEAPAPAKTWRHGSGLTVLTSDRERPLLQVPPLSGIGITREFRLNDGDSAPHWGTHPMLTLESRLVYGSVSYLDWLQAPTSTGTQQRFYVPTIRGLSPGQFLNIHGGPGYGGGVTRAYIQSLGYDQERQQHYIVADTDIDHKAGGIAHNKSNTGIVHMTQTSHADNQTYDVKVIRNQYAHGDTYIYYCDFNYMSNIHSAAGDENGNCYAAFIRSKDDNFRGRVEAVDWNTSRLTFAAGGAANVHSLGNSRPLINLNPQRHVTAGKVVIVTGRSEYDSPNPEMTRYQGVDYATEIINNPIHGAVERKFGGLIRGDKDCPWTADVVGRFFAVNETSEKTPRGDYRWYLITKFTENDDGTKDIQIERFWWGAKSAGSPTLYRPENYTWDGHEVPLNYIIAPGTYVNDVSRAVAGGDRGGQRILGLAPHSAMGTDFDFVPGDEIEQAIGPDPFKPQAMRVWTWEDVPGLFPSAVFDLANNGATSRYSAMTVRGGPENLDDIAARHEPRPAWDNIIVVGSAATVGLNLKADFADAAILFHQPNREQPIKWHYGHAASSSDDMGKSGITKASSTQPPDTQVASLTVSRSTGEFRLEGNGINTGGPVSGATGLSADSTPARNLRGKSIPIPAGDKALQVRFPSAEPNADYAVFIEQTWLTNRAVTAKTPEGFTITFADPAPDNATLDWLLVR